MFKLLERKITINFKTCNFTVNLRNDKAIIKNMNEIVHRRGQKVNYYSYNSLIKSITINLVYSFDLKLDTFP